MASDSVQDNFLFSNLRERREGTAVARMLRGLSFVMHGWCNYTEGRNLLCGEQNDNKLDAISFCKLATFLTRIWNEVYNLTCGPDIKDNIDSLTRSDMAQIVTFPTPFSEMKGKHGRTPARYDGKGPPIYINQIVYECQLEGMQDLFEVITPVDKRDDPNDPRATFKPGTPSLNADYLLSNFTPKEKRILQILNNGLKRLGPLQIRALGTHENYEKTLEDIEKEFKDAEPYRRKAIKHLRHGNCFLEASRKIGEYADEARRKSFENHPYYAEALKKLRDAIGEQDVTLKTAFNNIQKSPNQIWELNEIRILAEKSLKMRGYAKYLHAMAYYRKHPSKRCEVAKRTTKGRMIYSRKWHEGLSEMADSGVKGFPHDPNGVFVGDTDELKPAVRDRLIKGLESLKN